MPIAWQMQPGLAATSTCMFHASLPPLRVLVTTRSLQTGPDKGYPVGGVAHPLRSDDAHLYPARLGVSLRRHVVKTPRHLHLRVSIYIGLHIGTYMRLDLLLGPAEGCLGSTCRCIRLCGWKGVIPLSLSLFHIKIR